MATSAPSSPISHSTPSIPERPPVHFATIKAIVLIVLCMFGNYWLNRHFGVGFDGPIFAALMAGAGLAYAFIDAVLGEELRKGWMRRVGAIVLDIRTLVVFWVALIFLSLVFSSVTILTDTLSEPIEASLTSTESHAETGRIKSNKEDKNGPVHFYHVATTPLGKSYRLAVPGYLPSVIQVYPIFGTTIIAGRDLLVAPSVLFRPPELALVPMGGKVRVEAYLTKAGQRKLVAQDDHVGAQSILVGYQRSIPVSYIDSWRMELLAEGIKDEGEVARILQDWKTPRLLTLREAQLEPNSTLELIVYTPSGEVLAKGKVLVSSESLQDIPLEMEQGVH